MVIKLSPDVETALIERARREGIAPEILALELLNRQLSAKTSITPRDEWERTLLDAATDCGVSLPHSAVSSESLYE